MYSANASAATRLGYVTAVLTLKYLNKILGIVVDFPDPVSAYM